jgi:hypothetical protein
MISPRFGGSSNPGLFPDIRNSIAP